MCVYIYIYVSLTLSIYILMYVYRIVQGDGPNIRGSRLSDTTFLMYVFFNHGEYCSKL